MSFFNGYTGQTDKQHVCSKYFTHVFFLMDTQDKRTNNKLMQSNLSRCFYNGYAEKTIKHHIHSKDSTHVFLEWTHRTNRQTTYLFKVFYPCLFNMVTQDKRSNNIFTKRIVPMSFQNGHTGQTVKQHINLKHAAHVFLEWIHRTNCQTTY